MKTIILTFLFIASLFSQGMYIPNNSSLSGGILYGRVGPSTDNMIGFSAIYSYRSVVEISYTGSTVLTDDDISNYHNEYILRGYLFNGKRFFISGAIGYQDYIVETELWKNFPLSFSNDGFLFEGGLHLATLDDVSKKIVVSLFYRLFESEEKIQALTTSHTEHKIDHGLIFEAALIYYFGSVGVVLGPRIKFENNFEFAFIGFKLNLMIKH